MSYNFVDKAIAVHGSTYDYTKVKYVDAKTKVVITCNVHGDFEQTPSDHLQRCGCKLCVYDRARVRKQYTKEDFLHKAYGKHGSKYDYSKVYYVDSTTTVTIICKEHGEFEQQPNSHLQGKGCAKCGNIACRVTRTKSTDEFIASARKVHGDRYDYTNTKYTNRNGTVTVECTKHGKFTQKAGNHLSGKGCYKCGKEYMVQAQHGNVVGWSYSKWEEYGNISKQFNGFRLYIIECYDGDEVFTKVGKTFRELTTRFNSSELPYTWKILKEVVGEAEYISVLEEELHRNLKAGGYKYIPIKKFKGSNECYSCRYTNTMEVENGK